MKTNPQYPSLPATSTHTNPLLNTGMNTSQTSVTSTTSLISTTSTTPSTTVHCSSHVTVLYICYVKLYSQTSRHHSVSLKILISIS